MHRAAIALHCHCVALRTHCIALNHCIALQCIVLHRKCNAKNCKITKKSHLQLPKFFHPKIFKITAKRKLILTIFKIGPILTPQQREHTNQSFDTHVKINTSKNMKTYRLELTREELTYVLLGLEHIRNKKLKTIGHRYYESIHNQTQLRIDIVFNLVTQIETLIKHIKSLL